MKADKSVVEPSERARHILRVLIEQYVRDGQPVGSRTLSKRSGLELSPATIRNVMADLEDLGFVAAPHTSAGRIPTARGYRFFVDTLLKLKPLAVQDVERLQHQLQDEVTGSGKAIAETASSALSTLTSMAGIVTIPRQTHITLRQVEFLPLSDRRVLAILVVNDTEVENRILDMDREYSSDELQRSANYLNQNFGGQPLSSVRTRIVEELSNTRETMNQLMIDAVSIAQAAFRVDVDRPEYIMSGETKLMEFDELSNVETLKQLFNAFSQQQEILRLLDRSIAAQGVQIFIGEESGYRILDDCSIVSAPYRVDADTVGVVGVIGPTRMAYERIIPIVDITAKLVGAALNSNQ
jgi:heat-inducible transcriptional repressor